jgi:hypothetical protein
LVLISSLVYSQNPQVNSSNISGIITTQQLGAWAMVQHNNICQKIYNAISNYAIMSLNIKNKNLLKMVNPIDSSLNGTYDDPDLIFYTIDKVYDTIALDKAYYQFDFNYKDKVLIQFTENLEVVEFDLSIFKLFSDEELIYLEWFKTDGILKFEEIPNKAFNIIQTLNTNIYTEYLKEECIVFDDDSLSKRVSQADKLLKGKAEIIYYIQTDPNDPTIGYDSVTLSPYLDNINNPNQLNAIGYVFQIKDGKFQILALGCGLEMPTYEPSKLYDWFCIGYITNSKIQTMTILEKKGLEYGIYFVMGERLKLRDNLIENYLNEFKIKRFK